MAEPVKLAADSRPRLAPGVRLHFDATRQAWVLQAPERILETEGPAYEVLRRCDGVRSLAAIIDDLAETFAADRAVIEEDVQAMLADLLTKRMLRA